MLLVFLPEKIVNGTAMLLISILITFCVDYTY